MNGTLTAVMAGCALGTVIWMAIVVALVELRTTGGRHRRPSSTTHTTPGHDTGHRPEAQPGTHRTPDWKGTR